MTRNNQTERDQLKVIALDQLVRKLETAIDFSFIYPLVEDLYSKLERPSIDPVVLFKMTFIQYVFGIRSMRQTIKEIETNVAYRWFLGFGFYTEVPLTFSKMIKQIITCLLFFLTWMIILDILNLAAINPLCCKNFRSGVGIVYECTRRANCY